MRLILGGVVLFMGICLIAVGLMTAGTMLGNMAADLSLNMLLQPDFLFPGVLILGGLIAAAIGLGKLLQQVEINRKGVETYGLVVRTEPVKDGSRTKYYSLKVALVDEDRVLRQCEASSLFVYYPGTYLKVKYYKNQVGIAQEVQPEQVPGAVRQRLDGEMGKYSR